jgi:endoglucanase
MQKHRKLGLIRVEAMTVAALVGASLLGSVGCAKTATTGQEAAAPVAAGQVPPPPGGNLFKASTFEDGKSLPWMAVFSAPSEGEALIRDGAFCLDVKAAGTNRWDVQFRHREMVLQQGHEYTLQFRAWATADTKAYPKVGMSGPPYEESFGQLINLTKVPQVYQAKFKHKGADDPTAEFAVHIGGGLARAPVPFSVCVDDVYLTDEQYTPPPKAEEVVVPSVRVNQQGYLPKRAKFATVVSDATEALTWELLDSAGAVVASGQTAVKGDDQASGDKVHVADFSSYQTAGKGFVLKVGNDKSDPFEIGAHIYDQLRYDALAYFYHNRSGVEIKMPFSREARWARPAGHAPDKATCAPTEVLEKSGWPKGSGCDYELDVSGGWYDAGDHGKYVVNGGIALWTVFNQYERAKNLKGDAGAIGDKKLNIPESGNGVPDILDEARWQMKFMLAMQVPEGKPLAGMVHHKMHDAQWTALGLAPHEATGKRYLRPPSTAATLNVAATAAQCARIWKGIDAKFSKECLTAAERAWAAAEKNPALFAPAGDTNDGGGPYDDADVKDDFYWAAAELYITTGKKAYKDAIDASPSNKKLKDEGATEALMSWADTDALGAISLAVVPSGLGKTERDAIRARLIALADMYLANIDSSGYRTPFKSKGDGYPWGSNSFVVNNSLILGLANDFTGDDKYLDGVVAGMDYLLGRNGLGKSFITGYGERPLENPHHRFWAKQANDKYPSAPPGIMSGGPNSGLQDPYVKAAGLKGCAPQKCFVDNIEAWSANEITINWNAPLAWVTAFLAEKGEK